MPTDRVKTEGEDSYPQAMRGLRRNLPSEKTSFCLLSHLVCGTLL